MNFNLWLIDEEAIDPAPRAALAMSAIYDESKLIVFKRDDGSRVPQQRLRLEYDNTATDAASDAGWGAERKLIIFGIRQHDTLPDSDIEEGYRFVYDQHEYRVVSVIKTLGEVQASAERV